MKPPPENIAQALRSRANSIPQVDGEPPCSESQMLYDAADAIESLLGKLSDAERLIADMGEVASTAGFYAGQVDNAAKEAGKRAAYINAKAMQYFDPRYQKES